LPNTLFAVTLAAATARDGVVVELVTVGTSQVGQLPEGAAKLVTVPAPPLVAVMIPLAQVIVVPSHCANPNAEFVAVGPSAATMLRNTGTPEDPFGDANIWFADCELKVNACVPVEEMVVGEAAIYEGTDHVMLPIPEPPPEKVQVVVAQETPAPVNVKAPVVELIEVTPDDPVGR
jgi:hypothetical protein